MAEKGGRKINFKHLKCVNMLRKICIVTALCAPVWMSAQNTVKVTAGGSITLTGGALITLENMNLDNDGSIVLTPGNGTFRFSGNSATGISGLAQPVFDILEIAKTGGVSLNLQRSIEIASGITFTSGLINLNNNTILLQTNALLNGENENSRITGVTGGYVEITRTLNAPSAVNPGNLGAILTSGQNLGATVIRRGHQAQNIAGSTGQSVFRYYDILPANNAGLNATLRFQYLDAELNGLAESSLTLWKSPDNTTWTNQGFSSRDITANFVEQGGIADFSRWTLASPGGALPLVWGSFNTKCVNNTVILSWKTLQEYNSRSFIIQGSNNGNSWTTIATLNAAGQSNSPLDYSYTINQSSYTVYRILQTDVDNRQTYSPVLHSQCSEKEFFQVYPNPVLQNDIVVAVYASATDKAVQLRLFDSRGALIRQLTEALRPGMNQLPVNLGPVSAGAYNLVVSWPDGRMKAVKLIKQ
jgi:hypothetical protein